MLEYTTRCRNHPGVVTINGVNLDYGSYEHYKAYQRARKHRRRKGAATDAKEQEHEERTEEADTVELKDDEPHDNVSEAPEDKSYNTPQSEPCDDISEC